MSVSQSGNSAEAISLLVLNSSAEDTEKITIFLRNGGLAIHTQQSSESENLEDTLSADPYDLILCCAYDPAVELETVLHQYRETDQNVPLLIMADRNGDPELLLRAMREGARDLVEQDDLNHLQLVIAREFFDLAQRRELTRLQQQLQDSESRSLNLLESSREAIAFVHEGMHLHANRAYAELFGYNDQEEVEGLPLLDLISANQHESVRNLLRDLAKPGQKNTHEDTVCLRSDENQFTAALEISKAVMDEEPCTQVIVRPLEDAHHQAEASSAQPSERDPDTGLYNRHHFFALVSKKFEESNIDLDNLVLFYLELDAFAKARDKAGLLPSLAAIKEIGKLITEHCPRDGVLSRFGDWAFALLGTNLNQLQAEEFADTLIRAVREHDITSVSEFSKLTCSIGISLGRVSDKDTETLVDHAFRACRIASTEGGNRTQFFPPISKDQRHRHSAEQDPYLDQLLDTALETNRLKLMYQPIVSLHGDSREHYAVVVRLLGDDGKEILPESFIPQAERKGKMVAIDRWIVRHAIQQLAKQSEQGQKVGFFVSLSESSIRDDGLLIWICDCLDEFSVRGSWLTLQISEQHARDHLKEATKLISGLKKVKCCIALSQFGLLPKPAILLKHLPMDYVKFAPSFLQGLITDKEKQKRLTVLNELVLNNNAKGIATHVEEAPVLTILWTAGISYVQGNFLQGPSDEINFTSISDLSAF